MTDPNPISRSLKATNNWCLPSVGTAFLSFNSFPGVIIQVCSYTMKMSKCIWQKGSTLLGHVHINSGQSRPKPPCLLNNFFILRSKNEPVVKKRSFQRRKDKSMFSFRKKIHCQTFQAFIWHARSINLFYPIVTVTSNSFDLFECLMNGNYHLQSVTFVYCQKLFSHTPYWPFFVDYFFGKTSKNLVLVDDQVYQEKPSFPFSLSLFITLKAWMVILPTILHNRIKPFFLRSLRLCSRLVGVARLDLDYKHVCVGGPTR